MNKFTYLFATEENGYEVNSIDFDTYSEAHRRMKEDIIIDCQEIILFDDNYFEDIDAEGYQVIYAITDTPEENQKVVDYINSLREKMQQEF